MRSYANKATEEIEEPQNKYVKFDVDTLDFTTLQKEVIDALTWCCQYECNNGFEGATLNIEQDGKFKLTINDGEEIIIS